MNEWVTQSCVTEQAKTECKQNPRVRSMQRKYPETTSRASITINVAVLAEVEGGFGTQTLVRFGQPVDVRSDNPMRQDTGNDIW